MLRSAAQPERLMIWSALAGNRKLPKGGVGNNEPTRTLDDYENQYGVAVGIIKGEAKAVYNSKDFSVVAIRSSRTNIT